MTASSEKSTLDMGAIDPAHIDRMVEELKAIVIGTSEQEKKTEKTITVSEAIKRGIIRAEDTTLPPGDHDEYHVANIDMTDVRKVIEVVGGLSYGSAEWTLETAIKIIDRLKGETTVSADPVTLRAAISRELCTLSGLP